MKIKSKKIAEILNNPSNSEGTRHDEALKLAFYLIGEGNSKSEVRDVLIKNYPAIAQRSIKEIDDIVHGAVKRSPVPSESKAFDFQYKPTPFKMVREAYMTPLKVAPDQLSTLPEPLKDPTLTLFKALFKTGDYIGLTNTAIQNDDGKWIISCRGATLSYEDAIKRIKTTIKNFDSPQGAWFRVNPMRKDGAADKDVSEFRHCLVEFDSVSKEKQLAILEASKLPIATLTDSGGKSLHALIRIDAIDREDYDKKVAKIYSYLAPYGLDASNKNPSRWSRIAGVMRDGKEQSLLAISMGTATFDDWLADMDVEELPSEISMDDLEAFDRTNDPNNVLGNRWLCRGGTMLLQSQSGVGKSTLAMQMAISWCVGRDLFGIKAIKPLRIAIIQAENDLGDLAEQFQDSKKAMNLYDIELNHLKTNLRFFREQVRTGADFVKMSRNVIKRTKADLIIADPLLSYVGGDISKQEVIASFLRNGLNSVLEETGAIWIWIHHMGKPKDTSKNTQTDYAYSGLGSSDLANWARETMTLIRKDDVNGKKVFQLLLSKRDKRTGLVDSKGKPTSSIDICHSDKGLTWERFEKTSYKVAKTDLRPLTMMPNLSKDDALKWISDQCSLDEERAFKTLSEYLDRGTIVFDSDSKTYRSAK